MQHEFFRGATQIPQARSGMEIGRKNITLANGNKFGNAGGMILNQEKPVSYQDENLFKPPSGDKMRSSFYRNQGTNKPTYESKDSPAMR